MATELAGRAAAWAESEIQRLAMVVDAIRSGASSFSEATVIDEIRASLTTSFRIGYEAGRVDEEKAQRTRPRK